MWEWGRSFRRVVVAVVEELLSQWRGLKRWVRRRFWRRRMRSLKIRQPTMSFRGVKATTALSFGTPRTSPWLFSPDISSTTISPASLGSSTLMWVLFYSEIYVYMYIYICTCMYALFKNKIDSIYIIIASEHINLCGFFWCFWFLFIDFLGKF